MTQDSSIQECHILKNKLFNQPIVITAKGKAIIDEIKMVSPDVQELFFGNVVIEEDGLYLWKGTVEYPDPNDEAIITTISIEKVTFSTLDNVQG